MGNILDYLDWRGDLTFEQSPFNEVDKWRYSLHKGSLREIFHRKKRTGYESRKCVFAEYAGSS